MSNKVLIIEELRLSSAVALNAVDHHRRVKPKTITYVGVFAASLQNTKQLEVRT